VVAQSAGDSTTERAEDNNKKLGVLYTINKNEHGVDLTTTVTNQTYNKMRNNRCTPSAQVA
jgi:hypothetical protein